MPRILSGKQIIKILCKEFSFDFASQKGSHVKLKKQTGRREIVTIIPLHRDVSYGTLRGILKLAEVGEKDFWDKA